MDKDFIKKYNSYSQFIIPYAIENKNLCLYNNLKEVNIDNVGLNTYLEMVFNINKAGDLNYIFALVNKENNFYNSYFNEKGYFIANFLIPKQYILDAKLISTSGYSIMTKKNIIDNAVFWGDLSKIVFNEKSLAARDE